MKFAIAGLAGILRCLPASAGDNLDRKCIAEPAALSLAYSAANATSGGRILWFAGAAASKDSRGKSLAGDFKAQAYEAFRILKDRLARMGGRLQDIVTMTVFLTDAIHSRELVAVRKELFRKDCYPSSALVVVSGLADADAMLEIQAVAVVPK